MTLIQRFSLILSCGLLVAVTPTHAAELVANYRFESSANLGLDSTPFANHGTVLGSLTQVAGRNANTQAAIFDGTTSLIQVLGGLNGYDGRPGFTFAAWVNLDAGTTGFDGIVSQDSGACCVHRLLLDPTHQPYINVGAHDDRTLPVPQPTGAWFHIALVGQDVGADREGRVYVNGVEVTNSPQSFTGNLVDASGLNTYIGTGEAGTAHLIRGALDDVQIYEGALTAAEVDRLFQTGSALPPPIQTPAQGTIALIASALTLALAGFIALRRRV